MVGEVILMDFVQWMGDGLIVVIGWVENLIPLIQIGMEG